MKLKLRLASLSVASVLGAAEFPAALGRPSCRTTAWA